MHFYTQQAEPRHFVEMKTRPGEFRPTRISDAKKEGWLPSVTTILDILAKHALVGWKIDQHLIQAWKMPMGLPCDDYISEVKLRTETQMDKAPSAGTDLHNLMEKYWKGESLSNDEMAICVPIAAKIIHETNVNTFIAEQHFAHPYGYAGMVDLAGGGWVVDYKTKQTADKFKPGKMAYPDHARQLAAYRVGLKMPDAHCANAFVCLETGEVDFHVHPEADLQRGWETFMDCLNIWQRENYISAFVLSA